MEAPARSPAAPIACSTCDGAWLPELHAEPVETARSPSAITQRLPFDVVEADVEVVRQAPVGRRPVQPHAVELALKAGEQPIAQRSEARALGRHLARGKSRRRAPRPTMPGTFSVPERRPFSCPPPSIWHASGSFGLRRRT